ncbi:MAG: hypothetical protein ACLRSW_03215 [Christensenellaceae bacterium]
MHEYRKDKVLCEGQSDLDVTGRAGGYHLLDSFVASVDLFDLVCVGKRKDKLVSVTMHGMDGEGIPPERNNALKAGEAFVGRFSTAGADVTVYKNIPMGAGLGGSSADAAGVLNAMAKLYGIDDKAALGELADALGSDTRYMLDGGFCRMRGGRKAPFSLRTKNDALFADLSEKLRSVGSVTRNTTARPCFRPRRKAVSAPLGAET